MIGPTQQMARRLRNGSFQKSLPPTRRLLLSQSAARDLQTLEHLPLTSLQLRTSSAMEFRLRLIGMEMRRHQLRMEPLPNTQQRSIASCGREMSPQIDQAVFSRCDFFRTSWSLRPENILSPFRCFPSIRSVQPLNTIPRSSMRPSFVFYWTPRPIGSGGNAKQHQVHPVSEFGIPASGNFCIDRHQKVQAETRFCLLFIAVPRNKNLDRNALSKTEANSRHPSSAECLDEKHTRIQPRRRISMAFARWRVRSSEL